MTINQPVRELLANVSRPFDSARAMPPSVYTSEEFLKTELDEIFAREWVCVGRASALAEPGDYLTYQLAGEPLVVLRDNKGRLRAMSNVCRHRMSTILEGAGNKRPIVCPITAGATISTDRCAPRRRWISIADFARTTIGCPKSAARGGSAGSW